MKLFKNQAGIAHILVVVLIALVVGGVGFAGYRVYDSSKTKDAQNNASNNSNQTAQTEEKKDDIPEGFVEYKNEELGFRFAYPKEWGDVKVEKIAADDNSQSETGSTYSFRFVKKTNVIAQARTVDFTAPRGGFYPLHFCGFTEANGQYKSKWQGLDGRGYDIDGYEKIQAVDTFGLFKEDGPSEFLATIKAYDAVFNLTKNSDYPGIGISMYFKDKQYGPVEDELPNDKNDFLTLLKSFKQL